MQNKYYTIILSAIILILFYCINHVIPFNLDDLNYQFKLMPDSGWTEDINSISDIWESQYTHYLIGNGRSIANGIPQFFCGLWHNKEAYNILAMVMFLTFSMLLGKFCLPDLGIKRLALPGFFITFLFGIYNSDPAACYYGVDFGMNYLYSPMICLLFAYVLFYTNSQKNTYTILSIIIGFLAGWSHEEFCVGLGTAILIWWLQNYKRTNWRQLSSTIAFVIGACFLFFAPSNFSRLQASFEAKHFSVFARWTMHGEIFIFAIGFILIIIKNRAFICSFIKENLALSAAWITSILFICMIGESVYGRMMLGIELWGFILIVRLYNKAFGTKMLIKLAPWGSLFFALFLICILHFQSKAARGLWEVEEQGRNPSKEYVEVAYQDPHTPVIFQKFINPCEPLDSYFMDQYERQYRKKVFFFREEILKGVQSSKNCHNSNSAVFRVKDDFFSSIELEDTVKVRVELGKPLQNLRSYVKRLSQKEQDNSIILDVACTKTKLSPTLMISKLEIPVRDIHYSILDIELLE